MKFLLFLVIAALAIGATSLEGAEEIHDRVLVKIFYSGISEKEAIVAEDIDIWEVQENHVVANVTREELAKLEQTGFPVELLRDKAKGLEDGNKPAGGKGELPLVAYRNLADTISALQALETPGLAKVYDVGDTIEGRDIWAIKISDNVETDEDEPEVFFCGCHHAREWITVEVALRLAEHLVNGYSTSQAIRDLVDNAEIWILPVVNPDGYKYSWDTYRYWRKNRRDNGDGTFGVDPNRNYGYRWGGIGSSGSTSSDTYRGTSSFSEPETQAVRDLVLARDFKAIITYHNYGQLILYSWGYTYNPCPHAGLFAMMTQEMADLIFAVHGYTYTAQQSSDLYKTSGDTTDWAYGDQGIPAFTIELRPLSGGFDLPTNQIIPTFEENWPAAEFIIEWAQELIDQDVDGLPDCWEYYRLGNINYSAGDDSDIPTPDGMTNSEEYTAGTDPLDPESYFAITMITRGAGVTIEWKSVEGKTYDIYYSDDPYGPGMTWTLAAPDLPAAAGDITTWTDDGSNTGTAPGDPSVTMRNYRVTVGAG